MTDVATKLLNVRRQQAATAAFGKFALRQPDLPTILTEAARVCADGLDVPFSKICRYRSEEDDLHVEAGYGWKVGVVGNVISKADLSSPQGRAFITGVPSICDDIRAEKEFVLPSFYAEHGVVSTIDVVIKGSDDEPYGILEIDNNKQHNYDQHDIDFLTSFANILAEAVATTKRAATLQTNIEQMKKLIEEKDLLLNEKRILTAELQLQARSAAMGEMAATLAHELNQPLTAIASYLLGCSVILDKLNIDDSSDLQIGFKGATGQALRAGEIIRHVREAILRGAANQHQEDLTALVSAASALASRTATDAGVTISHNFDAHPIDVMVDKVQVQQVIFNLLRNGIEAMDGVPGHEVLIATRTVDKLTAEVSVSDRGKGVRTDQMAKLFEPFNTTKPGGMGVGLSICRTIIELHGGKLWVESNPEGGAIFRFTLPVTDMEPVSLN
jgi:signal transduction histidine kinase